MSKAIAKLYLDICKTYFPRWKPWGFTYNRNWGYTGYCNCDQKHLYFGSPSALLIIHEICHAVGAPNHGSKWQARVLKAAETAKQYDCELSKKLIAEVEERLLNDIDEKQETEALWNRISDTFSSFYLSSEQVNVYYVLKNLLNEMGFRKEWDEKKFEKMLKHGRKISEYEAEISRR
jgi:hypothetical protein